MGLSVLCALGGSLGPSSAGAFSATVTRHVATMGTHLRLTVVAPDREIALRASEEAVLAIEATEDRLSTWRSGTELDLLNRSAPGRWVRLSPQLNRDLEVARHWWRETGGAFDPGVAGYVSAWGLRDGGRMPNGVEMESARRSSGFGLLEITDGWARRTVAGFAVEEGGFGKGVALRDAAAAALDAGAGCVELDFGGQLLIRGECGERVIGVADPRQRDLVVAQLPLKSGSVATSGNSERAVPVDGVLRGHILDPRKGWPAPNWGSVTVLAEDPVVADCCATALFVMGPELGLEWARQRSDLQALFIQSTGEGLAITSTPGIGIESVVRGRPATQAEDKFAPGHRSLEKFIHTR